MAGSPDWLALGSLGAFLVIVIVVIPALFPYPKEPTVALRETAEGALRRARKMKRTETLDDWVRRRVVVDGASLREISAELAELGVVISHVTIKRWAAAAREAARHA